MTIMNLKQCLISDLYHRKWILSFLSIIFWILFMRNIDLYLLYGWNQISIIYFQVLRLLFQWNKQKQLVGGSYCITAVYRFEDTIINLFLFSILSSICLFTKTFDYIYWFLNIINQSEAYWQGIIHRIKC